MLSKRTLTTLLILISAVLSGCKKDSLCNCFESTGNNTTETRLLADFTAMEMDNNVDVVLVPGSVSQVKVTCGKNLVDGIRTEVKDSKLYISNKNKCNWLRDFKIKFTVEVFYDELTNITNRGSGNLSCNGQLKMPVFQVDSWNGSGILNFDLDCNEVFFKLHTGPADIFATGKTGTMYIYSAGNGYVKVAAVESENTYVTSKSTGDCEVNAINKLEAIIEYNGDVYYKGSPANLKTEITGKGKMIAI
jgi:hypothetical protein